MNALDSWWRREWRGASILVGLLAVTGVLRLAGSTRAQISAAAADPQGYVTAAGADQFVLALATAIGWLLLGWVALGAILVLGSAAPGWIGWAFAHLARLLLPVTLRRFVSLALGISLLGGTSVASAVPPATMAPISVTVDWPGPGGPTLGAVPDWPRVAGGQPTPPASTPPPAAPPSTPQPTTQSTTPTSATTPAPSAAQPDSGTASGVVVAPGDCLWDIAERRLAQDGQPIDPASVSAAVTAWWLANSTAIPDPDLIYPGQVLMAPSP